MPISTLSPTNPLSRYWTHQQVVSEVMVLTNTTDNEQVELDNIRNHINVNISYLANLLNLNNRPFYTTWATATLDSIHPSGLDWIDLADTANNNLNRIDNSVIDIKRISVVGSNPAVTTDWIGNCRKMDISELTMLNSMQNVQYRHSICWTYLNSEILIYSGNDIVSNANLSPVKHTYDVTQQSFIIWYIRKPILDDLLPPVLNSGSNYFINVDLPDQYIDLLIKMTQKKVLEQRREQIPGQLEQEVNVGLQQLQQALQMDIQMEASERMKNNYGIPQKPPGAM